MTLFSSSGTEMFQFLSHSRPVHNAQRILPVLKNCWRNVETEPVEASELQCRRDSDINRFRRPKTYKKQFIQNLFLGIFEPEVLEYPQIRTKVEVDYLKEHAHRTSNLMLNEFNNKEIGSTWKITKETYDRLKEIDVIGMKIKLDDKGLGYFESESSYIQESFFPSPSLGKTISENETSGYQIVQWFGTDSQKCEYLPKFLKGECLSCLAHLESEPWVSQSASSIDTIAVKEGDGNFVISGRKTLVYNPNCADILIVSARIDTVEDKTSYALFIIDKNEKGVSVVPSPTEILKGAEICDVFFDKVIVSGDKLIGKVNGGSEIIDKLVSHGKLSNGAQCIGVMRKLVNDAITHCIYNNHFKRPLHTYKYVQGKIGEIINTLYAAESMTYLMNGRLDEDPDLDAKLESLIVKVFNSEALNFILYNYMHIVGKDKCNEKFIESLIGDSLFFTAFDDPNAYLKTMLATVGVQHTLDQISHRTIKEFKPKSKLKLKLFENIGGFRRDDTLSGYLHLTFELESIILKFCTQILNYLTELLIAAHGNETLAKPFYLSQLGDLTIIIYKLTATLGRSSRAYCIGLRHCEHDVRIARNIAQNSYQRALTIYRNVKKVLNNEPTYKNVSNYVAACRNFSDSHPAEPGEKSQSAT